MVLAGLAWTAYGQSDCLSTTCSSSDVALMKATNTDATNHYYIGAMFDVHKVGADLYKCEGPINIPGIINLEAFFWAINKYKQGVTTVSVGGFGMDSCSRTERAIENVFGFQTCRTYYTSVSPRNTVAFVGPTDNDQAIETASLLKDMQATQVSSMATSPELSKDEYNYFLRTIPSDAIEVMVLAKVIKKEGIRYVQMLVEDSMYGKGLMMEFMKYAAMYKICIVQYSMIGSNTTVLGDFLKQSLETRVVVLLAGKDKARFVLQTVNNDIQIQNQFFFVGTSQWGNDVSVIQGLDPQAITIRLNSEAYYNKNDVDEFWTSLWQWKPDTGSNALNASVNTHNPWFAQLWSQVFNCTITSCNIANQNLKNHLPAYDKTVPYTLLSVDAIIRGVRQAASSCGDHFCSNLLNIANSRGPVLYSNILEATSSSNTRYFKDNGDAAAWLEKYEILEVNANKYEVALRYDSSIVDNVNDGFTVVRTLSMGSSACNVSPCLVCNETAPVTTAPPTEATTKGKDINLEKYKEDFITAYKAELLREWRVEILNQTFLMDQEFTGVWRRDQVRPDEDWKTRFEKGQDWIIALGVCAGLGIVCVLVFEIYILYKLMGTKIGKQWRTMWLGQLLLFGIFCAYLVCFAYLFTPTKATCGITRFGVGVTYAMCFAVLLVKLMVLLTSKTSADNLLPGDVDSPNYLRGIYQFLMYLFIVGVQIVIAIQWLIMVPPDAVQVMSNNGDSVWVCNHYTWTLEQEYGWNDMRLFIRTNFENHLISLAYVMFLVLLTVIIAMKSHGIITNHRESVFIGIAAGFSVPVFIAWGLVGGLNKDKEYAQEFGDASIAFGLLIVVTIVLFSMFLPKVRQLVNMGVEGIYLEDDRDTYYAGSVVMAPPSYKSRPSSVVYVNSNGYNEPVILGDPNAVHLKHPGSNYSAPVFVKRPESTIGGGSGKVLRMTGDLTGKHPRDNRKSTSEVGYAYAGSGYGTYRKSRSESGGTLRRAHSTQDLGAL